MRWAFRAQGRCAHWGGIHFGPERMTQLAPSRSAIVGLLRSVFGKYEYRWEPLDVTFLRAPSSMPVMSNEIQAFDLDAKLARTGLTSTQRIRTFLYDIDIVIRATISIAPCAGQDDDMVKAVSMIDKRVRRGYRRYQPYFGIRECPAHLTWLEDANGLPAPAAPINEKLGHVFYDLDMDDPERPAYLAPMEIKDGVIVYPAFDDVRRHGIRYHLPRVAAQ